jgi:class 3 adenylate cyclase
MGQRALECAWRIRDNAEQQSLGVRIGVHVGEVELTTHAAHSGFTRSLESRSAADRGEIHVSEMSRALASSAGLEFEDSGDFALKGLEGSRQLHACLPPRL